jgi:hypothetical protein
MRDYTAEEGPIHFLAAENCAACRFVGIGKASRHPGRVTCQDCYEYLESCVLPQLATDDAWAIDSIVPSESEPQTLSLG